MGISSGILFTRSSSSSCRLSCTLPGLALVRIITRFCRVLPVMCLRVCRFFLPESCFFYVWASFDRCMGRSVPSRITSWISGNCSKNSLMLRSFLAGSTCFCPSAASRMGSSPCTQSQAQERSKLNNTLRRSKVG
jgi:hypothetical protein